MAGAAGAVRAGKDADARGDGAAISTTRPDGPVVISLATLVPANDPRIQVYSGAQGNEVLCSQLQTGLYHPHFQPTRSERRNAVLITS